MKKSIVYVDPACDILYSSYYIHGLKNLFGKVKFCGKYFSEFKHNNKFLPVVIKNGANIHKLIFDFGDGFKINEQAMAWCDVYGKININDSLIDAKNYPKLVSIGPGFGLRIFSKTATYFWAGINYLQAFKRIPDTKRFFSDYFAQYKRQSMDYYKPVASKSNYIFFAGALWKKENETNRLRANYIRACKRVEAIQFEGGFAPRSKDDITGYEDITLTAQVPMSDYLTNIKESAVVFNTPVIHDCHGWKLGEFMALGKAMVTTKIINRLPAPLEYGKAVHFIEGGEDDIYEAVKLLTSDHAYRQRMEKEIHQYFLEHVTPEKSVQLVLYKAGLNNF
jgi:glycosyltransferase involved in cell wall biosynthesis